MTNESKNRSFSSGKMTKWALNNKMSEYFIQGASSKCRYGWWCVLLPPLRPLKSQCLERGVWDKGIWNLDQETLFVGDKNTYETKYRNQMGPEMKNLLFMVCQQPSNPLSLARDRELLELGRWQTYNKEMEQVAYWEYAAVVDTLLDSLSLIWGSLCY